MNREELTKESNEIEIKKLQLEIFRLRGQLKVLVECGVLDGGHSIKSSVQNIIHESEQKFPL